MHAVLYNKIQIVLITIQKHQWISLTYILIQSSNMSMAKTRTVLISPSKIRFNVHKMPLVPNTQQSKQIFLKLKYSIIFILSLHKI